MKTCIACGMPMTQPSDYPGEDETRDYCKFCARPDGTMQSYSERLEGMTGFLIRTQGLDGRAARDIAARTMAKLPAWKDAAPG